MSKSKYPLLSEYTKLKNGIRLSEMITAIDNKGIEYDSNRKDHFIMYNDLNYFIYGLMAYTDDKLYPTNYLSMAVIEGNFQVNLDYNIRTLLSDFKRNESVEGFDLKESAMFTSFDIQEVTPIFINKVINYKDRVLGFAVFFEMLESCDHDDKLKVLDDKIKNLKRVFQNGVSNSSYVYLEDVPEEMKLSIYLKYYKRLDLDLLEKLYRNLNRENQELVKSQTMIRKFKL